MGGDRAGQPTAEPVFGSGKNVRSSTPSESPRKNSFRVVETLALTPPLSPGPGQAAYERRIVSRHDRNVGGRQAHFKLQPEPDSAAPLPAHNPQADYDSDSDSDADRCDVGAPTGVY